MLDEIRQNGKTVLSGEDGFSIPMFFNNLCGKNFSGEKYRDYIRLLLSGKRFLRMFLNACFVGHPMFWRCRQTFLGLKLQEKAKKHKEWHVFNVSTSNKANILTDS